VKGRRWTYGIIVFVWEVVGTDAELVVQEGRRRWWRQVVLEDAALELEHLEDRVRVLRGLGSRDAGRR